MEETPGRFKEKLQHGKPLMISLARDIGQALIPSQE
jgi:hypothetical protein